MGGLCKNLFWNNSISEMRMTTTTAKLFENSAAAAAPRRELGRHPNDDNRHRDFISGKYDDYDERPRLAHIIPWLLNETLDRLYSPLLFTYTRFN